MIDDQARLWVTARIRAANNPAFCKKGSTQFSAAEFLINNSGRQVEMYDPKSKKITHDRSVLHHASPAVR